MKKFFIYTSMICIICSSSDSYAERDMKDRFKNATPEQKHKYKQKMKDRFKNATPEQRSEFKQKMKDRFKNATPEQRRNFFQSRLKHLPPEFRNIGDDVEDKRRKIMELPPSKRKQAFEKYRSEIRGRFTSVLNKKWDNASSVKRDALCTKVKSRCSKAGEKRKKICGVFINKCNNR